MLRRETDSVVIREPGTPKRLPWGSPFTELQHQGKALGRRPSNSKGREGWLRGGGGREFNVLQVELLPG